MSVEWSGWPLLEISAAELPHGEARSLVVRTLSAALHRGEPFAALVQMPPDAPRGGGAPDAAQQVRAVRELRPGLAEHCRGLAFVLSAEEQARHSKVIQSGTTVWGCPTTAVDGPKAARVWLHDCLAKDVL
ncbi:hypothetical protein ABT063_00385 [Streptomyces sp. NPDC002838]|uniref:hypothetical protein n=1 Tax=Streptomyces sp. NPDC002838 TaxID=3154436 RepID=UPI00332CE136